MEGSIYNVRYLPTNNVDNRTFQTKNYYIYREQWLLMVINFSEL